MSWVAVGITAASVGMTLIGGQQQAKAAKLEGQQRKAAADAEATVLESNATQQVAVAQRNMIDATRVAKLAESRATALAAASGGGATSPTALKVVADIAREGSYNSAKALYQGEETARMMRLQAYEKRVGGEFDVTAGNMRASAAQFSSFGTAIGQGGGLYGKYGGNGPGLTGGKVPGQGSINWDLTGSFGDGTTG